MLCACVDIGTNTTRVLVAESTSGRLTVVLQRRAFTRMCKGLVAGAPVPAEKVAEVARVVAEQCALARQVGVTEVRVVATAAIRGAGNRDALLAAIERAAGVPVQVLGGEEEARLAFLGATRAMERAPDGAIGVVDVGGGSTEIAVGTVAAGVSWAGSFRIGSGHLAEHYLHGDPPTAHELHAVAEHAAGVFEDLAVPPVRCAVAVGGSATSLRRLLGAVLEPETLQRALRVLSSAPAVDVARRLDLDLERVRLLPAGILVLDAAAQCLGRPLQIGRGGLREGVLLDLARRATDERT